jgi:hypothetical protein
MIIVIFIASSFMTFFGRLQLGSLFGSCMRLGDLVVVGEEEASKQSKSGIRKSEESPGR